MTIEFSDGAVAQLAEMPAPLQSALEVELRRLDENPVELSRRAPPAYPTGSMRFRCFADIGDAQWYVEVLWIWKDSQDEETIIIIAFGPNELFEDLHDEF